MITRRNGNEVTFLDDDGETVQIEQLREEVKRMTAWFSSAIDRLDQLQADVVNGKAKYNPEIDEYLESANAVLGGMAPAKEPK